MDVIRLIAIRDRPLSVDEVQLAVADPAAGAIALFAGTVRSDDHDRIVTRLSYSAHPSAETELRRIGEKVAAAQFCLLHMRVRVAGSTAEEMMTPINR